MKKREEEAESSLKDQWNSILTDMFLFAPMKISSLIDPSIMITLVESSEDEYRMII